MTRNGSNSHEPYVSSAIPADADRPEFEEDDVQAQWRRVVGRRSFLKGVGFATNLDSTVRPVCDEEEQLRAFEAGADDYVTKPFRPRELVARLLANLRRAEPGGEEPCVELDGLEIDLAARAVRRDGDEVHLTPIEFKLLGVLTQNRGRMLTHNADTDVDPVTAVAPSVGEIRSQDHWHRAPLAQAPAYLHAVPVGQHELDGRGRGQAKSAAV